MKASARKIFAIESEVMQCGMYNVNADGVERVEYNCIADEVHVFFESGKVRPLAYLPEETLDVICEKIREEKEFMKKMKKEMRKGGAL